MEPAKIILQGFPTTIIFDCPNSYSYSKIVFEPPETHQSLNELFKIENISTGLYKTRQ